MRETAQQYDLGDLIERLSTEDPTRVVSDGFRTPHSYRGYYEDVAFERASDVRVGDMLAAARDALGSTYTGWKGGDYDMHSSTACWLVAAEGCTGDELDRDSLDALLVPTPPVVGGEGGQGLGEAWPRGARLVYSSDPTEGSGERSVLGDYVREVLAVTLGETRNAEGDYLIAANDVEEVLAALLAPVAALVAQARAERGNRGTGTVGAETGSRSWGGCRGCDEGGAVNQSLLLVVMLLVTLVNLGVLGLTLKLYTEWFKDRAISARRPL